jgi:hypothetical protein
MNHKKLRRLYREEGLQVCRGGRKRALATRAPMALPLMRAHDLLRKANHAGSGLRSKH